MKKITIALSTFFLFLILFFLGPRPEVNDTLEYIEINDPEEYIISKESLYKELKPNTQKQINWYSKKGEKTEYSLVYVHGFSASRQEIAPVPELVAKNLGANFFATRLTGHGLPGEFMKEGNVHSWLNDGNEAIAIGRLLGNKVLLIGVSTGATVISALISKPEFRDIHAVAFISPNFSPRDKNSSFLTIPWGNILIKSILGNERKLNIRNEKQGMYWTAVYPSIVLRDMMALVQYTNNSKIEDIKTPILFYYHEDDKVISTDAIQNFKNRLASNLVHEIIIHGDTGDSSNHLITGEIMAPNQVNYTVEELTYFFQNLKLKSE